MSRCRSCGAEIMWIRSRQGKQMPVDVRTERFYPDKYGPRLYVLNDGHVMRGTPIPEGTDVTPDAACGHASHFATCPQAEKHRKARR